MSSVVERIGVCGNYKHTRLFNSYLDTLMSIFVTIQSVTLLYVLCQSAQ